MTSIVLVHGAWGGSYGFGKVRPLLGAAGHDVFTPSLTGIGERSHLTGPHVDLDLHIQDVANTVFYEDLDDIVLLGFSYGGMVVTGLVDQLAGKINHLIYLDAFVPANGESALDILGPDTGALMTSAIADGLVPPIPRQLDTPEATAWSNARRVHQPIGTLNTPVKITTSLDDAPFTRTYIKASANANEPRDSPFWKYGDHANASPAWNYHEIATDHMVPMTRPQELAAIIAALAS